MQRNFMIVVITFTLVVFASSSVVFADPFISYPGTRARAMGGAFTGIADDASAVWYNPAGIAGETTELIAEWSQAVVSDDFGELSNDENKYFIGGTVGFKEAGLGLFYLSPYTIDWYFPPVTQEGKAFGHLNEVMNIVGAVGALSWFDERLKIGGSLEFVWIDYGDSNLQYNSQWGTSTVSTTASKMTGWSGSIGVLLVPVDFKPWALTVNLGGVYRFPSSTSPGSYSSEDDEAISEQLIFEKPSSHDIGIAITKSFTKIQSSFTLSGQYGITNWNDANDTVDNDYTKVSVGCEWQLAKKMGIIDRLCFRGGWYDSKASDETNWPNVQGITWGIGIRLGETWGLEFCHEDRELTLDYTEYREKFSLTSGAITISF